MYLEVYPDVVFFLNSIVDIILIFILKKVNKKNSSIARIILAGAAGASPAVVLSIFPWMNYFLKFVLMYVLASLLMILIAFGKLKAADLLKQWIFLNLITYFFGGFMNAIYYHTNFRLYLLNFGRGSIFSNIPLIYVCTAAGAIGATAVFLLWLFRLYQLHRPLIYDVELVLKDRRVRTKGLMDTGNCLYDPVLKRPVMVMENDLIEQLATPEIKNGIKQAKNFLEGKTTEISWETQGDKIYRFSFIPYRSVGKCGMMLGIRLDKVMIYTENETFCNEKVTAAICDNPLSDNKDYHVILHKGLL